MCRILSFVRQALFVGLLAAAGMSLGGCPPNLSPLPVPPIDAPTDPAVDIPTDPPTNPPIDPPVHPPVDPADTTAPEIISAAMEGSLMEGKTSEVKVLVRAIDQDGTIASVRVDLTPIGGQAEETLSRAASDHWTYAGSVTPVASGIRQVTIVARDKAGNTRNATASIEVTADIPIPGENQLPKLKNAASTDGLITDQENTVTLSVEALDEDGSIVEVSVDLTEIGGAAIEPLSLQSGNLWSWSGVIQPATDGERTLTFTAIDNEGALSRAILTVNVSRRLIFDGPPIVLGISGVANDLKVDPGASTMVGQVVRIALVAAAPVNSGEVTLRLESGSTKVKVWSDAARSAEVALPRTWKLPAQTILGEIYVEGIAVSETPRDIQISVTYNNAPAGVSPLTDRVRLTVFSPANITKLPLGKSVEMAGGSLAKLYIPSRYGGRLTVRGGSVQMIYTDGSGLGPDIMGQIVQPDPASVVAEGNPSSWNVPSGKSGWCYIKLLQAGTATIKSEFIDEGQAGYRPWNGWWWPFRTSSGPTLYNAGGPFDKYDQVYGTSARLWEETNQSYGEYWFGHCWGWSIAAIMEPDPVGVTKSGVTFTADDIKGLYTELYDCDPYYDSSLSITYMPALPCSMNADEAIDTWCDDFYRILRIAIRDEGVPLQSDMRARGTPPEKINEVWNQSIFRYAVTFSELDGQEQFVRTFVQVWSNYGPWPPPTNNGAERYEEFVFYLEFGEQGQLIADSSKQNWVSSSHYPPQDLLRLTGSSLSPKNPYITKAKIDALYEP